MNIRETLKYNRLERTKLRVKKMVEDKFPVQLHTTVKLNGVKLFTHGNVSSLYKNGTACFQTETINGIIQIEVLRK